MDHAINDNELLSRIAAGEQAAVRTLFARHHLRIFRFIMRKTGNEATAEELTNEVFLEIWRHAGKFEGRSKASTWMLSIAHNRTVSLLRRRSEAQLEEGVAEAIADDADTPEVSTSKRDKGEHIRACMDRLTPDHRAIIDLVYYHEKSIPEIAEILDIPQGTVKTRMFHAHKKLGEILKQEGVDRGWP